MAMTIATVSGIMSKAIITIDTPHQKMNFGTPLYRRPIVRSTRT
jgi:hypothetical protein